MKKVNDILPRYIISVSQCNLTCLVVWLKYTKVDLPVPLACLGLSHGCPLFLLLLLILLDSPAVCAPPLLQMLSQPCAGLRILTNPQEPHSYTGEDTLLAKCGGTHV